MDYVLLCSLVDFIVKEFYGEFHRESRIKPKTLLSEFVSSTGRARANPYLWVKLRSHDLLVTFESEIGTFWSGFTVSALRGEFGLTAT